MNDPVTSYTVNIKLRSNVGHKFRSNAQNIAMSNNLLHFTEQFGNLNLKFSHCQAKL